MSKASRMRGTLAVVALLLVGGCSSNSAPSDPTSPTTGRGEQHHRESLQYFKAMAGCLTENGFPARYDSEENALVVNVGPGHDEDYDRAEQECQRTEGITPPMITSWTDAEMKDVYNQTVESYHCLVAHGYQPLSEPPTLQKFVADYRLNPYDPYANPGKGSFPDDECPQPTLR